MKEKYKAIIEQSEETKQGVRVLQVLKRYTCANNQAEARKNIIYHLQNDDKIYLGIDMMKSSAEKIIKWEITRLDIERNYEEEKEDSKEVKEKEKIKFNDEYQLAISNKGTIYKVDEKERALVEANTHLNGKALCVSNKKLNLNVAMLVYTAFKGKIEGKERYRFEYIDNNPSNCELSNLRLISSGNNNKKKYHFSEEELKEFIRGMKERGEI